MSLRTPRPRRSILTAASLVGLLSSATSSDAETGYDLWLRYRALPAGTQTQGVRHAVAAVIVEGTSPTASATLAELRRGLSGFLGTEVPRWSGVRGAGAVIAGTPAGSPLVAGLGWKGALAAVGPEGYVIRSVVVRKHAAIVIASEGDMGALYGAFHLLRLIATGKPLLGLDVSERPRLARRLLNHWDNLDGSIERGYAGASLWKWGALPAKVDERLVDYARANASIGINGTVLNNVNAKADSLSAPYLDKAAAIAGALRPYGIRVYLSANFSAPRLLGGLPTADPLDPRVARFWKTTADAIYERIPDFGGFLVKANSEGQPGPQDYGRTHADGANVLADALASHGGVVMWRAFVYNADVDPDRTKRAYLEFVPLDGTFRPNVMVQVKNGALDFQPREPFHPMFGAMPGTPLLAELQVTQEYLGHSTHLVYLAPMWKEFLDADTFAKGPGSLVSKVIDGSLDKHGESGIAGVANTGSDTNWCGHDFAQANWFAYGRLAWNPDLGAEAIADDWIRMTWGDSREVVSGIRSILLDSHRVYVRYTMPLGLHHLIGGDHYAPMPENDDPRRLDWTAIEYHRASPEAVGYDRTSRGSGAVAQYRSPLRERWGSPETTPEALLLWFHRLPWSYAMKSGRTLWGELVHEYSEGVREARDLEARWNALETQVDPERHGVVAGKLRTQAEHAAAWRDHCLDYFQKVAGQPWPERAIQERPRSEGAP